MSGEVDILGVLVAPLLAWAVLAFVACLPLYRLLAWAGAYRFVWHRSLFNVALYLIVLAGIAALAA